MKSLTSKPKPVSAGFTLIELMVALTISAFLVGGILLMNFSGRAASIESEHLSRVQENVRFTSDFLVRELRNAGFRDEISLRIDMYNEIANQGFAVVSEDGSEITIRMSGARTCGNQSRASVLGSLVTNRYYVENGNLMCQGTSGFPTLSLTSLQSRLLIR
jgi:type IV pilus assembly protein PilW